MKIQSVSRFKFNCRRLLMDTNLLNLGGFKPSRNIQIGYSLSLAYLTDVHTTPY